MKKQIFSLLCIILSFTLNINASNDSIQESYYNHLEVMCSVDVTIEGDDGTIVNIIAETETDTFEECDDFFDTINTLAEILAN